MLEQTSVAFIRGYLYGDTAMCQYSRSSLVPSLVLPCSILGMVPVGEVAISPLGVIPMVPILCIVAVGCHGD